MTLSLGYTLSSEEHPPQELVAMGRRAEDHRFDYLSISDHLHPWVDAQGHSPFVWSVLGALAQCTERVEVAVGVTCPIVRFPPLLAAHATATMACLLPGRFTFGVGSGESLNEHVTGDAWPAVDVRQDMLREAIGLIRELWRGDLVTHRGEHFRVEAARLYDVPEQPPPLVVSAFGPKAGRMAAELGDGLWTHADPEVIDAWRDAGGSGPVYSQLTLCYDASADKARSIAREHWPNAGVPGQLSQDLPTPRHFEMASSLVTEEVVAESVLCGPDPEPIVESVRSAMEAGVDHVNLHQVGLDQDGFLRFWDETLEPALRSL